MSGLPVSQAYRLADRAEEQRWLVTGLWSEQAVGIVGGEPKCCKSFLALDLAVAVASGTACLRRFPVARPGRVLLYAAEDALHVVRRRLEGICAAAGCTPALTYTQGYIPLANDAAAVQRAQGVVQRLLGDGAWAGKQPRSMTAEDFAFYLEKLPGALLRLGLGEAWPPLHSAGFDFNDGSIEQGIMTLAGLALDVCGH